MTPATPRKRMSQKRRQAIFTEHCTAHNLAPCCLCGVAIHRHDDRWIIEHIRALGLLGKDSNPNCGPAHYDCARVKTATQDVPRIAKARRQGKAATPGKIASRGFWRPEGVAFDWKLGRYTLPSA